MDKTLLTLLTIIIIISIIRINIPITPDEINLITRGNKIINGGKIWEERIHMYQQPPLSAIILSTLSLPTKKEMEKAKEYTCTNNHH